MTKSDAGSESGPLEARERNEAEATGKRGRSAAEWTTLAISVTLILGLLALVTYVTISGGNDPPIVEARSLPDEIRHEGESYYLPVAVTNHGGRTAEEVLVQGELVRSDRSAEATEFTLDFLAGGETREGTAVFATDPLAGELTINVASFQ